MELNKFVCADSLELMREMPDNSVDLVLTDPPYGIGESNQQNQTRGCKAETTDYGDYEWDQERIDKEYFDEIRRISKHQVIFGGNYYTDFLPPSSCWVVWDKDNGDTDFADCEMAWASFDKAVRQIKWKWQGMLQENHGWKKEERVHPTQKPVPVFRKILERFADEDWTVFDPFMGSGSSCLAAKQLGMDYIGVDKKRDYVEIARQRLKSQPERIDAFVKNQNTL